METATRSIKYGWVWFLYLLIFFFNTAGFLPEGLTMVMILTPLWIYFLYNAQKLQATAALFIPLLIYIPLHFARGVEFEHYVISFTSICCLIFFIMAFYVLINIYHTDLDLIFRDIAILNFFLAAGSILFLFLPALKETVWYMVPISNNIKPVPRLKLFTSEASHYSFILAPIAIYFYSRVLFSNAIKPWLTIFMVTFPLILSFSLGVWLGLLISGGLVFCIYINRVLKTRQRVIFFFISAISIILIFIALYIYFPYNPLFLRIKNIFAGSDTSARGRTYEAFMVAHRVISEKSFLWGVGPGQLKLLGRDIVIRFYNYSKIPQTIRIPNACAETIAYFGYTGFALRILTELFLFFRTRVFYNPYRLWLFLFVFIYQFTGSYITNAAEYVIWVLAFSDIYPVFVLKKRNRRALKNEYIIPGASHLI